MSGKQKGVDGSIGTQHGKHYAVPRFIFQIFIFFIFEVAIAQMRSNNEEIK